MRNGEKQIERPLRWAMVGGGRLSQVGYKHRIGALQDNTAFQLTAGAFDIDPERGKSFGMNLGVEEDRCYADYKTMFAEEAGRKDGIEAVSIATPNGTHFAICKAALEAGLHVICEKPLFFTSEEGELIKTLAEEKGKIVGVTYGFSGAPMLLQMRAMIAQGKIGDIRIVDLQYTHGFCASEESEKHSDAQKWRVDPAVAGPSFVLGDLSTHTYYMSQLIMPEMKIERLLCDRQSFVGSRAPLEDNAYVLMHYENGAVGTMWTSSVNAGCMDGHRIRIVGSKASLEWRDSRPDELVYEVQGKPVQKLIRGMPYLDELCLAEERLGALHAEGLSEAWSNIYLKFAIAMDAKNRGDNDMLDTLIYPDIKAGTDGIRWIENCVRSADRGAVWVDFE
ncbi:MULTISPECIES: Gfo/Idh/MocA family protein [Bacillus]|jgi:predicted dehydrogenase|uniref:Gfo/Idh/MocA family protein n=1 Tax=Bacillus TaxID=1386 RepID=UPI000B8BF515|nr:MULTISPECIES: Gfo/Idh/MocA family oxidoreductase [Bacillus]MCW8784865.1 Gfo/Idh/MocA family oxidoreductase [Bacillus velezensis]MEC2240318.1 Gfo/Idh/MocA family oxidoreductase [Bacillus velezensis]NUI23523.1 Gfo/Idh/MocA family oxidoreductase [Bacillus amyloliquefaciens]NUI32510.1 Gfo/Idh/MocA family oxidoreductase [Bacillus amyloliquefaciens]NUI36216.1 Gfo/Idh/MocA family oxidoreductase [Bacillus amyloliquefaciens]